MYVLEQYLINVSSVGWTNATQLETLCLCYVDQTSSEVPISSLNRDTVRKGGETAFSFPRSSLPRCRVVITQREVLIRLGILPDANAVKPLWKTLGIPSRLWRLWGKTPACSSVSRLDAKRNLELVKTNNKTVRSMIIIQRSYFKYYLKSESIYSLENV